MSSSLSTSWTLLCHRLGRQDESQLRSEASQSKDATDQDVRRRLAELLPDERQRLTLQPAEDRSLTGAHLLADLGLALTLDHVLISVTNDSRSGAVVASLKADANGRTPLHFAAAAGHWDACKALLAYGSCCMSAVDNRGRTPLDLAVAGGHAKWLEEALNFDDSWRQFLSRHRDHKGRTALHCACRAKTNGAEVLELLLRRLEAPGELARERDEVRGWPAGFYAARRGDVDCLRQLASRLETMSLGLLARADDGRSLLHAAAQGGSIDAFEFGVSLGLDPTAASEGGDTPAHDCARAGHANLLRRLLNGDSCGALCGAANLLCSQTPLHCAAESDSAEAVRALVEAGHPMDALDDWGRTPVETAWSASSYEAAAELESLTAAAKETPKLHDLVLKSSEAMKENSDLADELKSLNNPEERRQLLWQRDGRGCTAAHAAARVGNNSALKQMLMEEPRLLMALTPRRETLLHVALREGTAALEATVEQLLQWGARPDVVDSDGETALRLAARGGLDQAFDVIAAAYGGLRAACSPGSYESGKRQRDGSSLLHTAAAGGSVKIVRRLLALRLPSFDPFLVRDSRGRLPVHWAARAGSADCLDFLLRLEAASGRAAPQPPSLYHLALRSGSEKTVSVLDQLRVPILRLDSQGRSLLHSACASGNQEFVRRLLDMPAPFRQSLTAVDHRGETPAHAAAGAGRPDILRLLLDGASSKNPVELNIILTARSKTGETVLHAAARAGCIESARLLIKKADGRLSIDSDEGGYETAAHTAARTGQSALLAELVLGCVKDPPAGLLHAAADAGQSETVAVLLASGRYSPFERDAKTGRTAAHCAAASGDPATLRAVLAVDQDGVMARSTDSAGRSLLHAAAAATSKPESHRVVRRLLRMNGDAGGPKSVDSDGRTPIELAVLAGAAPALAVLVKAVTEDASDKSAALSQLTDSEGRGLLHSACLTGRADTVLLLVAMGLSPWQLDMHGLPPVAYAAAAECSDALRALADAEPIAGRRLLTARVAEDGASLAHVAAHADRPSALRLLAAAGLSVLDALDANGWSPLQLAVAAESWNAVQALVDEAVSLAESAVGVEQDPFVECLAAARILDMRAPDGRSLLHLAVAANQPGIVTEIFYLARMLESSSPSSLINPILVADKQGLNPLHEAVLAGHAELARLLLTLAPSALLVADTADNSSTYLHLAVAGSAFHGSVETIRLCLELWPYQASTWDAAGLTPPHLAAANGLEAAMRIFLDGAGFFYLRKTPDGNSLLHLASSESVVRLLSSRLPISSKQDRNQSGRLPSEEAQRRGRPDSLVQLLQTVEMKLLLC